MDQKLAIVKKFILSQISEKVEFMGSDFQYGPCRTKNNKISFYILEDGIKTNRCHEIFNEILKLSHQNIESMGKDDNCILYVTVKYQLAKKMTPRTAINRMGNCSVPIGTYIFTISNNYRNNDYAKVIEIYEGSPYLGTFPSEIVEMYENSILQI